MSDEILSNRFTQTGREDAWHKKGTHIADGTSLYDGALEAGLDVQIEVLPLTIQVPIGDQIVSLETGQHALVRMPHTHQGVDDPAHVIGTCSGRYHVLQNMDLVKAFEGVSKYYPLETAGVLKEGEIGFFTLNAGQFDVTVNGKQDPHKAFVYAIDHKAPGNALNIGAGSVRVVCFNTLTAAEQAARILIPLQHTEDIGVMVEQVAKALQALGSLQKANFDALQMMANKTMTAEAAKETFKFVWPDAKLSRTIVSLDTLTNPVDGEKGDQIDLVGNAIVRSDAIKAKIDTARRDMTVQQELVEYLRETAEIALGNMTDAQGLGLNAYTVMNAVSETLEHRSERKHGDVATDMLIGERARTMDRLNKYLLSQN